MTVRCHSTTAEKHCTSHWGVESPSFRYTLLKLGEGNLGGFANGGFPNVRERSCLCPGPFWEHSLWVLFSRQRKRKRQIGKFLENSGNPEKIGKVPQKKKKDKSGRTSPNRETLPFKPLCLPALDQNHRALELCHWSLLLTDQRAKLVGAFFGGYKQRGNCRQGYPNAHMQEATLKDLSAPRTHRHSLAIFHCKLECHWRFLEWGTIFFCVWFNREEKSPFASDFWSQRDRASWGL